MLGDGLIVDERLCSAELRPPSLRRCFVVCDHHRNTYRWTVCPSMLSRVSSI